MLRSDRFKLIVFGLVITALTVAAVWHVSSYNKRQRESRDEAASYIVFDDEDVSECAASGADFGLFICLVEKIITNQEQERGRADLHAQQDMATWAVALLWVSIFGLLSSIGGLYLLLRTLNLTREIALADRRPWVGENGVRVAQVSRLEDGRWYLLLHVTVQNDGSTPALQVAVGNTIGLSGIGDPVEDKPLKRAIESRKTCGGELLNPNCQTTLIAPLFFTPDNGSDGVINGNFGGWIQYQFDGSREIHVTPFIYQIGHVLGNERVWLLRVGHQIPAT